MDHLPGEKISTKYGMGTVISVNERQNAYLVRWDDGKSIWVKAKDVKS